MGWDPLDIIDPNYLAITAIVTVGYQLSFFALAATCKFDKVTDFAGGTNFMVLALLTFLLQGEFNARQCVATAFVLAWGIRLSCFLFIRILITKTDKRFDDKRENFLKFLVFWIIQMFWVWLVHLPVTFVNSITGGPSFGSGLDISGIILFAVGLLIETVSDQQKFNFKNKESNRGKICDVGIWKYSRHPNYFGELILWWGIFLIGANYFRTVPLSILSVLSPLFINFLLLLLSGMPILEKEANKKGGNKPEYLEYKKSTSILVPLPPALYRKLPLIVKQIFLFEWPLYEYTEVSPDESQQRRKSKVKIHPR